MTKQRKNLYYPDRVSAPGETLLDLLEERGITQEELVERTECSAEYINDITRGQASITSEIAIQLEKIFGVSAEFWNQREANYRAYRALQNSIEL